MPPAPSADWPRLADLPFTLLILKTAFDRPGLCLAGVLAWGLQQRLSPSPGSCQPSLSLEPGCWGPVTPAPKNPGVSASV